MKIQEEDRFFQYGCQRPIRFYRLKRILYPLVDAFWHLSVRFIPGKDASDYKYSLSAVLIFKDEAPFLREWIEYHRLVGVEHFYLYQNNSSDSYLAEIQDYLDSGTVTLTEWPDNPGQYSAYRHWYENYRRETKWVTFIDIDEFLCPGRADNVVEILDRFQRYPVILVYWKLFGTGGQLTHDYRKTVIEQYTCCRPKLFSEGKIIYRTRFDIPSEIISMHYSYVKAGFLTIPPVNTFGHFVFWDLHRANKDGENPLQLNHYWSKSYDCWEKKYEKGSVEKGIRYKDYAFFEKLERKCTSTDHTIFRFLVSLKKKLNSL